MPNNLKSLIKHRDAAAAKVAALEARRAERRREHATLTDDIAALDEQLVTADAAGEAVTVLEAERAQRLQRQRDLAAVLPLLEQQLAEARAELHAARLQVGGAQLAADERALIADGLAFAEEFGRDVLAVYGPRATELLSRLEHLGRDEHEVDQLNGRRARGWTARDRFIRDTRLLMQQLIVLCEWAHGRPTQLDRSQPAESDRPETELDRRLRLHSTVAEASRRLGLSR